MKRRVIVEKQDTCSSYRGTFDDTSDPTETEYTSNQEGGGRFVSIVDANYNRPRGGTKQDNMTKDEIKAKLVGYVPLRSMKEKEYLTELKPFKTWIKYINTTTKQFRTGGLLMKVVYPDYIMLANTSKNLTWSVQLKDNIIFVPDPDLAEQQDESKRREQAIKDRLYTMYKKGELNSNKRK